MNRFRHRIRPATLFVVIAILALSVASCESGGPVSPTTPAIALSMTSLVFSNLDEQKVTISNIHSDAVDWRVLSSTASWLTAAPANGRLDPNADGLLTVKVDRRAVPVGTHSAAIQIGAPGGTIILNILVQPAISARAHLQPQLLNVTSSETVGELEVANQGNDSLSWTLNGPQWATIMPAAGSLAPGARTRVLVTPDRSGLASGRHVGTLHLDSNGGSASVTLNVDVEAASGIRLEPATLDFGTAGSQHSLWVVNVTDQSLDWQAHSGSDWISLSVSSGKLPPGLKQLLTVRVSRSGLSHGTNQSSVLFTSPTGSTSATVKAAVLAAGNPGTSPSNPAQISIAPASLDFTSVAHELTHQITNQGDQPLHWSAQSEASWIDLPVPAGTVAPHSSMSIPVRVTRSGLTAGTYQSAIRFSSPVGTATSVIRAVVTSPTSPTNPSTSPSPAKLYITPDLSLGFGLTGTELSFKIRNTGGSPLDWSAKSTTGWVNLPISTGRVAPDGLNDISVRVARAGLTAGDHTSTIQISSNGGSATVSVSVKVPTAPPPSTEARLVISPDLSLGFGNAATQLSFKIQNMGGSSLNWSANPGSGWINLPVSSGGVTAGGSQDVNVNVSRAGLTAGDYQSSIQVTSNGGNATIVVSLKVSAPAPPPTAAEIGVTPVLLDFGLSNNELSFKIQNAGGSPLDWSAMSVSGWTSLPISTGRVAVGGAQDVKVRVSRTGLTGGDYETTVQITSNGGSATVVVRLKVSPPPTTGNTVNVRDFGARGDGATDDSPAFAAAIAAVPASGGTVIVPSGTYVLDSYRTGPYRAIDIYKKSNITIAGDGMDNTILRMAPAHYPSAVFMVLIRYSSGITIKDLTVDANVNGGTLYSDEQSHVMRIVASTDVRIDGVRFKNSPGDGLYIIGLAEAGDPWTERVRIENSHFLRSWRNAISIQRGVRHLQILGNTFEQISQQSISAEPSGNNPPENILIQNNLIRHWEGTASYTISMSGTRPSDPLTGLIFRGNRIEAGEIYLIWVNNLKIESNTILGGLYKSPIRLQRVSNAEVVDNTITGQYQNETGVVQIVNDDERMSSNILVQNNRITVEPGLSAIYVRDASGGITITENQLVGSGGGYGILFTNLLASGTTRTGFRAVGNSVKNFSTGIGFIDRGDNFSNVDITSNTIDDETPATATTGVLFDGTGSYSAFAQVLLNVFGPGIATPIRVR